MLGYKPYGPRDEKAPRGDACARERQSCYAPCYSAPPVVWSYRHDYLLGDFAHHAALSLLAISPAVRLKVPNDDRYLHLRALRIADFR